MPHEHDAEAVQTEAPGLPAEEGVDLATAEGELAQEPEEKENRTDGASGADDD